MRAVGHCCRNARSCCIGGCGCCRRRRQRSPVGDSGELEPVQSPGAAAAVLAGTETLPQHAAAPTGLGLRAIKTAGGGTDQATLKIPSTPPTVGLDEQERQLDTAVGDVAAVPAVTDSLPRTLPALLHSPNDPSPKAPFATPLPSPIPAQGETATPAGPGLLQLLSMATRSSPR